MVSDSDSLSCFLFTPCVLLFILSPHHWKHLCRHATNCDELLAHVEESKCLLALALTADFHLHPSAFRQGLPFEANDRSVTPKDRLTTPSENDKSFAKSTTKFVTRRTGQRRAQTLLHVVQAFSYLLKNGELLAARGMHVANIVRSRNMITIHY